MKTQQLINEFINLNGVPNTMGVIDAKFATKLAIQKQIVLLNELQSKLCSFDGALLIKKVNELQQEIEKL